MGLGNGVGSTGIWMCDWVLLGSFSPLYGLIPGVRHFLSNKPSRSLFSCWGEVTKWPLRMILPCQSQQRQTKQRVCFDCAIPGDVCLPTQLEIPSLGFLRRIRDIIWSITEFHGAEKNTFNIKSDFKVWAKMSFALHCTSPQRGQVQFIEQNYWPL